MAGIKSSPIKIHPDPASPRRPQRDNPSVRLPPLRRPENLQDRRRVPKTASRNEGISSEGQRHSNGGDVPRLYYRPTNVPTAPPRVGRKESEGRRTPRRAIRPLSPNRELYAAIPKNEGRHAPDPSPSLTLRGQPTRGRHRRYRPLYGPPLVQRTETIPSPYLPRPIPPSSRSRRRRTQNSTACPSPTTSRSRTICSST